MAATQTEALYERIYALVREIPPGRVATYGQIARIVGCTARVSGYAMAAVPGGSDVPWHRVINSQGKISPRKGGGGEARQKRLLREEGLRFDRQGRVKLDEVRWEGPGWAWLAQNGYEPDMF
ncbi:MAG: MGMT family protein [Minwuiales bacterium]|nr:MGMT family protein [Minwuiales bacterium]